MRIDTKEIAEGRYNEKYVWICDFRLNYKSATFRPDRHIEPIKVFVQGNGKIKPKHSFYFVASHFVKLKKNGGFSLSTIKLYDNTGDRIPVQVFDNELECQDCYNKLAELAIKYKKIAMETLAFEILDISKKIKKKEINENR